jgi:hypothetical protein
MTLYKFQVIIIDGVKNIKQNMIPLKTKSFLSLVVHLKEFGPYNTYNY